MKLVILLYSMAGGGAERVISHFLPYLIKKNIEVHLVLMNPTFHYDIPAEIPIHYIEQSNPNENRIFKLIKLPWLAYRYMKILKDIRPSHSFSLLARPNYINLMAKKLLSLNYKVVISERSYPSRQYGSKTLGSRVNKLLIKKLYNTADKIIPNSEETSDDLFENFNCPKNKIKVIYNPIDLKKISTIKPIAGFFDNNYFNIVAVGRLQPVKNHELLIRSVKNCKNVRLYILGHGYLKDRLENIIVEEGLKGKVFLLGFDKNPYKYMKSADLFILSSNHEGFPNVLLEAMACGLPVISTNCKSGPRELMKLDQEKEGLMYTNYGILVPVDNVDLMTKAIQEMSKAPDFLENCAVNCRKRVLDFKLDTILEDFTKTISNC